jgi:hypothetical protein
MPGVQVSLGACHWLVTKSVGSTLMPRFSQPVYFSSTFGFVPVRVQHTPWLLAMLDWLQPLGEGETASLGVDGSPPF